jgi:DNA topoisomerase-1
MPRLVPTRKPMSEHHEAAKAASLRYVTDAAPGIRRRRSGRGFTYHDADGKLVRDRETLRRIRALAIPPAWTDVWICPLAHGHIQATGHDAKGRKQYRYHKRWHAVRDETKYGRLADFAHALPRIRRRVRADLALPGLPRDKVLAMIVRLLETTMIRIGNEEYARENRSFGLTTMQNRHLHVERGRILLKFKGKSGKSHEVNVADPALVRLVKHVRDLPGQQLFQYVDDDGKPQPVDSQDVNEYLQAIAGDDFTAKDFRTWGGTLLAAALLSELPETQVEARSAMLEAINKVARQLGNTPTICRKSYIHPAVLAAFTERESWERWSAACEKPLGHASLRAHERRLLRYLAMCERARNTRSARTAKAA